MELLVELLEELKVALQRAGKDGATSQVEELILELGAGRSDQRLVQALNLWFRNFGRCWKVMAENFKAYLAGIPQIPAGLLAEDPDLPFLSLADPRPGLLGACQLVGVLIDQEDERLLVPFDDRFPIPTTPFWFRHDDGRKNLNRRPDECRDELQGDVQAASAMEGVFAYAHHPVIMEGGYYLDLPRTVHKHTWEKKNAEIGFFYDRIGLYFRSSEAHPKYGTLLVRRK